MLAVQTAHENLFVPDLDIASLTPVYPGRIRVVLADGRVGHHPVPLPPGPWVQLHDSLVNPQHLTRVGDHWKDPAGYLYPYQPLADIEIEEEESDLPDGLIAFEVHDGVYFWRTDRGLEECDLKPDQALQLYPQLCPVGKSQLVNMRRVRSYGTHYKRKIGWFQLDNEERFEFSYRLWPAAYQALGVESLVLIDRSQPPVLLKLRDFPYDLTSADPDLIRRDCPTPRYFAYNLLWQTVLQRMRGQSNDYGRDTASFARHPLASAGKRCGYQLERKDLSAAFSRLVHHEGLIHFTQLGFVESDPGRRKVGKTRPEVLLVAAHSLARTVLPAAEAPGISLLLAKGVDDRLTLENLAPHLPSPLHIFFHKIKQRKQKTVLRILEQLDLSWMGAPIQLDALSDLADEIKNLPEPYIPHAPEPFRRIPLQAREGWLLMVDPEEIAAWSPTLFSRWRVVLVDGQVLHHPGPVPAGPWVSVGEHWVQPHLIREGLDPAGFPLADLPLPPSPPAGTLESIQAGPALPCPPERIIALEDSPKGALWHLDDGSKIAADRSAEQAAPHHPGLVRVQRTFWVHHNRIRLTSKTSLQMDGGLELRLSASLATHQLRQLLGVVDFGRLAADDHNLLNMGIRDFPFEIARAPAAVLRQHFRTAHLLVCNILYQTYQIYQKTGVFPYGDTFTAYFYRPLQATLYRAGFLTRAQFRAPWRELSAKDRMFFVFTRAIFAMVYHYRLFTYRQFGFKDPFPEDRIIGSRRPAQILLVEKGDQIEAIGRQLQQKFGLTLLILKGNPSLLASEYFAEELKANGLFQVEILFYGDFDYAGWDIGPAFRRQLKFYGIESTRLARLVLPQCFTANELPVVSRPLDMPTASIAGRVKRWLQEGGGINGEARGIHANWLFPYSRVVSRLEELLA